MIKYKSTFEILVINLKLLDLLTSIICVYLFLKLKLLMTR